MLLNLHIKNFVLIDDIKIDFSNQLTIITGETGAGKSILLGALNLLLGQRADTSVVKNEDKACVIEGSFDISSYQLTNLFGEEGIDYEAKSLIRREIRANGKSRAFINDNLVTLSTLRNIADKIIDIHEQFDNRFLSQKDFKFQIIDSLSGQQAIVKDYQTKYRELKEKERELKTLKEESSKLRQKQDFLEFQLNEIINLQYRIEEFQELEQELALVKNAEFLEEIVSNARFIFEDSETNILDQMRSLSQSINSLKIDFAPLQALSERLESSWIELEDIKNEFSLISEDIEVEPGRSEQIESRMSDIFRIMKKHQLEDADEIPVLQEKFEVELSNINDADNLTEELSREITREEKQLRELAKGISATRNKVKAKIEKEVLKRLAMLQLDKSQFTIELLQNEELDEYGQNKINYLFSANPGIPMESIEKVASGGEISRLALSIKALVAQSIPLPTIVFDEIDSGVSGAAANKMGQLLHNLSRSHQVICITHSPQVASKADEHLFVYKEVSKKQTRTFIKNLTLDERINELAIMMSSNPPGASAIENAKYLLEQAQSN
ncbi:DNA repair protein RecN [Membranihabitans maritimus]|uniref:DNA repair protein RecN n=1 Tax=Membranihabitans maritimus TaxID=2904244 RepID=UPI001F010850|nr:DNA repair protein RecN [Membranihabitans maritimus]